MNDKLLLCLSNKLNTFGDVYFSGGRSIWTSYSEWNDDTKCNQNASQCVHDDSFFSEFRIFIPEK